jgi:hypothetical protein
MEALINIFKCKAGSERGKKEVTFMLIYLALLVFSWLENYQSEVKICTSLLMTD